MSVIHSAPKFITPEGLVDELSATLGERLISAHQLHGETVLAVARTNISS